MFSKRLMILFLVFTRLSNVCGVCPLVFNFHTERLRFNPIIFHRVKLHYTMLTSWCVLSLGVLLKNYLNNDWAKFYLSLVYWTGGAVMMSFYAVLRFFSTDAMQITNGMLSFYRFLQRRYLTASNFDPDKSKLNIGLDLSIILSGSSVLATAAFTSLYCILHPRSVIFLGALIPPEYFSIPLRVVITLFHVYLMFIVAFSMVIVMTPMLMYLFYLALFLPFELRLGRKKYLSSDSLRTGQNLRLVYRGFQVLNANAMCLFGCFILFTYAAFTVGPVLSNFVLMTYWDTLPLVGKAPLVIASPMLIFGWSIVCTSGRFLFVTGNKVLSSWRGHKWGSTFENKSMGKFRGSCRLVLISYGTQFVLRRVTLLNYYKGVTRGTFRCLLTMKT